MRFARLLASLCLLLPLACLSDVSVPDGALIDCDVQDDCPTTHVCSAALGRCVPAGADDQPPSLEASTLTVSPELASAGIDVEITFSASESLGAPPSVDLTWADAPPKRIADVTLTDEGHYLARYVVTGEEPEGFAALAIELVDDDGNRNRSEVPRALELDFTPPTLVESTISIVLEPPAGSPLDDVTAAGVGTRVRVLFAANEALLAPPTVASAEDTGVTFELTDAIGTFFTFTATVPAGAPQGPQALHADLTDAAGNQARASLGTLTLDSEAPAPPTVDTEGAVTYVRVPWGSEASDGAPAFSLELAAGTVEEGAVVLVRDSDDVAIASELGRSPPFAGTSQDVALARTDREAVWVSAVDAAGNESAAVRVRDVRWVATLIGREARSALRNPHRVQRSTTPLAARESPLLTEPTTGEIARLAASDGQTVSARGDRPFQLRTQTMPGARFMSEMVYDSARGRGVVFGGLQGELELPADTWEWDGSDWRQRNPSVAPTGRVAHSLAYDAGRAETVLFGGLDLTRHLASTWVYDGSAWSDVTPPGDSPSPRVASSLAFDPVRGRALLFGGGTMGGFEISECEAGALALVDGSCFLGDTWEWDGDQWLLLSAATAPAPRAMHAMAYDVTRGGIVLFGGCLDAQGFSDLGCDTRANDTWLWDGAAWTDITASVGTAPPARVAHRLVTTTNGLVLAGGATVGFGSDANECDTAGTHICTIPWRLDDDGWDALATSPLLPLGQLPSVTWDTAKDELVAMNPSDDECEPQDSCNRTLVWTQATSDIVVHLEERPSERKGAPLSYDDVRNKAVMFGGDPRANDGCDLDAVSCDGLWEWDGNGWDLRCTGDQIAEDDYCPTRPDGRSDAVLAYDSARARSVLFGGGNVTGTCDGAAGLCGTTWGWDGSAWTPLCQPLFGCTSPSARRDAAMAYDRDREVVVLFGGGANSGCEAGLGACGDTWEWNGSAWSLINVVGDAPLARAGAAMVYDEGRGVIVMYGGARQFASDDEAAASCLGATSGQSCRLGDVWTWDGSVWSRIPTTDPEGDGDPVPRHSAGLAYDAARGRIVLHGGQPLNFEFVDDAWELDDDSWRAITPRGVIPGPRESHGMTFDRERERLVLFGGDGGSNETWEWASGGDAKSALLVEISFLAAGADPAHVHDIDVVTVAGGLGYTLDIDGSNDGDRVGDPVPGAALAVWDTRAGRWSDLDTVAGGPDALSFLEVSSSDAEEARRWIASGTRGLALRLSPLAGEGNGPSAAEVILDYVEVIVRYRLP